MAHFHEPDLLPLNDVIRSGMALHQTPGCAIGIIHRQRRHLASFGVTSIQHPLEVTPSTLFQIGSITKTFTALALAMLADSGQIDLDAPVRSTLPDFRVADEAASAAVTVRQLLTHTSGWVGDVFRDTGQGDDALSRYVASLVNVPQLFAPGTNWSYNNAAFAVAGRVIEQVSGMPVEDFLIERILQPLGMHRTRILARSVITQRTVSGHLWGGDKGPQVAEPWWKTRATSAVGSITSSVEEMCRYMRFQLAATGIAADGTQLLSAAALQATHARQAPAGNAYAATGLAWLLRQSGDRRYFGHSGATLGQMASCIIVPDADLACIVVTNGQRGDGLCSAAIDWVLRELAQIVPLDLPRLRLPQAARAEYVGRYQAALTAVDVSDHAEGLRLQTIPRGGYPLEDSPPAPAPPAVEAHFVAPDQLLLAGGGSEDGRAEFMRDSAGNIAWLRIGARLHTRV